MRGREGEREEESEKWSTGERGREGGRERERERERRREGARERVRDGGSARRRRWRYSIDEKFPVFELQAPPGGSTGRGSRWALVHRPAP